MAECENCEGRGHLLRKQDILSTTDGRILAQTVRRGANCPHCCGTGLKPNFVRSFVGGVIIGALLITLIAVMCF